MVYIRHRFKWIVWIGALLLFFSSCIFKGEEKNAPVSNPDISIVRFDKLLNDYVSFNSFSSLQRMNTEYPLETKLLIEDIIVLGDVSDNHINAKLKDFFSDPILQKLMRDALHEFQHMEDLEIQFNKAFKILRKEVPALQTPTIYAQFSALNESVVVADSLLGFSIDKYLGEDYSLYSRYYYEYQRRSMKRDRIVPDCLMFYLVSQYPFPLDGKRTLLDIILHYGKMHYLIADLLDFPSQESELGYNEQERQWCEENTKSVWEYMLHNGHLYATDPLVIRKYTKPSPYTAFFGESSPALVGIWMGTKLVSSYMEHNRHVTVKELLEATDYQQMLVDSKFNP